jgi:hypothetical protein
MAMNTPTASAPLANSVLYRVTFSVAALVAAVAVVFFVIGLADGSVSSFNITLWVGLLAGVAAVLVAGYALRARNRTGLAIAMLCILAVPGVLYGLFIALVIVTNPRWN